ncbi:MAG: GNAT family N-acetyltransferase [Bernardetiaceae bacterium]|jgi:hypothetical protein|nr:GNAT family N-acetyltransferase [Bernardetiaceae bacterium]
MYRVVRYAPSLAPIWNAHLAASKNATFMFHRDYLAYHQARFTDHSVLVYHGEQLLAVLPANEVGPTIYSHQGLSYGGLALASSVPLSQALGCFYHLAKYYAQCGSETLIYKALPSFYAQIPAQEETYALWRLGAQLHKVELNTVADLAQPTAWQTRRHRGRHKAEAAGVTISSSFDYAGFWEQVLVPNLQTRHQVAPAHTAAEMAHLARTFPAHIQLFQAGRAGEWLAGAVVFEAGAVAHAQYISANEAGKQTGALDALFAQLLRHTYAHCRYFSFGVSTYAQGTRLNQGLAEWKAGFGAHAHAHVVYQVACAQYPALAEFA